MAKPRKHPAPAASRTDWRRVASRRLRAVVAAARKLPTVRRRGPSVPWQVGVQVVGETEMKRLNTVFRRKRRATDVLSFPSPPVFYDAGHLGELVICLPVLKAQARDHGHSAAAELRVLLVHGVLHLLGFDHEKGGPAAREMARLEARLAGTGAGRSPGLIARSRSGN